MKMNLNLNFLIPCFVAIAVASCAKKGDVTAAKTSIVGNWKFAKDTLTQYKLNGSVNFIDATGPDSRMYIIFKSDGKFIAEQDITDADVDEGTYTITGTTLDMKTTNDPQSPDSHYITTIKKLDDHSLALYYEESNSGYKRTYIEYFAR